MTPKEFKKTKIGKIPEDWEECKKNGSSFYFNFNGKVKKIKFLEYPKKPFISDGGTQGIRISKQFFEKFNPAQRVAILWHEFYHCRHGGFPVFLKLLLAEDFNIIKPKWDEEYNADKFSATENNPESCLSVLEVCKILYKKGTIERNKKLHPPIEERIKRIRKLK